MPIQHAIWKVGDKPLPLCASRLASDQKLEEMIVRDSRILSSEWMLIGRQEVTNHGGYLIRFDEDQRATFVREVGNVEAGPR